MSQDLRSIARRIEGLDPGGDEALELVRAGLVAGGDLPHRFQAQLDRVLAAWAVRVVAHAARGSRLKDRNDTLSEACLWLLERLREFRPDEDGGSVAVFVRARFSWFRSQVRRDASEGLRSHGRFTVAGATGAARERFRRDHRRDPSSAELKDATAKLLTDQTLRKVLEKDPTLRGDELAKVVQARMRKDGLLAALDDFDSVLVDARDTLRFDLTEPDDDTPPSVPLPPVEMPEIGARDAEDSYERLLSVALGDSQWARSAFSQRAGDSDSGAEGIGDVSTLRDHAGTDHSVAELKKILAEARARVHAPHAQWAHLADITISS